MTGGQRGLNDNNALWLLSLARNAVRILELAVKRDATRFDLQTEAEQFLERFGGDS